MTDMLATPTCAQGHAATPGAAFCPQCGTALASAATAPPGPGAGPGAPAAGTPATTAPARAAVLGGTPVTLRDAPFADVPEDRRLGLGMVFVLSLAGLLLVSGVTAFMWGPRLLHYAPAVAVLVLVLWRARALDLPTVGAAVAAVALDLVIGPAVLEQAVLAANGWTDVPVRWPSALGVFGSVGRVFLAAAIVWFCVPRFRTDAARYLRPTPPAVELSRVLVVAVGVVLALLAVGRALTGWAGVQMISSQEDWAYQNRVAQCTSSVNDQFPEFDATERQNAIDYCVSTG